VVQSDHAYCLCLKRWSAKGPHWEAHTATSMRPQDDSEAAAAERKRKAVDAKELDWVHHHLREEKQDAGKEGGGGFLRGMIDTVIGNLQLSITNIHIRYEVRRTDNAVAA
jgi:Vacuolar sorting-associated protein 13, N-terminal